MYRIILLSNGRPDIEELTGVLAASGHAVARESPQADVPAVLGRHRPQLALVDALSVGPRLGEVCAALRRATAPVQLPILAVVTPDWLKTGDLPPTLDDFLCQPATAAEVQARLNRAIWSRAGEHRNDLACIGSLVIDHARHQVFLDDRPLDLTLREYDLLSFLAKRPGRVFSRESLLDGVWGLDYFGGPRTVDVHIRRLRVKLDDEVGELVQTVRGVGYRLNPDAAH